MTAEQRAREQAACWARLADIALELSDAGLDPAPDEAAITGFDPTGDLRRRAERWQHRLPAPDLATIARFGAGLALAEAGAWADDDPVVATRAFEDRRFLLGDRLAHWAVPWLACAGDDHPALRPTAWMGRDVLLDLAGEARVAPDLVGSEGVVVPGEDSFGPLEPPGRLASLLSGTVLFASTIAEMGARARADLEDDARFRSIVAAHLALRAAMWDRLAGASPGSARLWRDLAARARRTEDRFSASEDRPQ